MSLYSIVVPVYNSQNSLQILYDRVSKVFDEQICQPFELILVDDCSTDDSYSIIKELIAKDNRVKGIQLAVNHGQQKAILCGFSYVQGDYVITMDDDLQHPPEEISKLIEKMNSSDEIDVVIGAYDTKKHNAVRRFGTWLMSLSSDMIFKKPKDLQLTSFRLIKRYVVDNINRISISKPTIGPLLLQTTKRIENETIRHDARQFGKSGYSFKKLVKTFWENMLTNSDIPLRSLSAFGLLSSIFSVILIIVYIIRYFVFGSGITGWTSLMVLVLFFGGMILLSMGIVGRYLIIIITETKKMPSFNVRREDICTQNGKDKE